MIRRATISVKSLIWFAHNKAVWRMWLVAAHAFKKTIDLTRINSLNYRTKPLRMIMKEAKIHSDKIKPVKFDIDVIADIINSSQK